MILGKFLHEGLKRLYEDDDGSGLPPHSIRKIKAILAALEFADTLSQVATLPGWRLHSLKGSRKGAGSPAGAAPAGVLKESTALPLRATGALHLRSRAMQ